MGFGLRFLAAFGVLFAVLVNHFWVALQGSMRPTDQINVDKCHAEVALRGCGSVEDITVDGSGEIAWLSCDTNRREKGFSNDVYLPANLSVAYLRRGNPTVLRTAPITNPEKLVRPTGLSGMPTDPAFHFRPHGITITPDGKTLFVVNHPPTGDSVEIFDVVGNLGDPKKELSLEHKASVSHPLLTFLNDVEAFVDGEAVQLYGSVWATNQPYSLHDTIEKYMMPKNKDLIRCWGSRSGDNFECEVAASDFAMANGVAANTKGDRLYVVDSTGFAIHEFARDLKTGALRLIRTIDTEGSACDNIFAHRGNVDARVRDRVLSACHYHVLKFDAHKKTGSPSPSEVVELLPNGTLSRLLLDDGRWFSGSASAAFFADKMIVGAVIHEKAPLCDIS
jgi:SMP-30/Gluconolactonase/LRE-like region